MSAGLFACPTCNATLRVPAGATAIRCPQCKTVLEVDAPAPAAPPLPFGAPKPPRPPASPPKQSKAPPRPAAPPPPPGKPGRVRAALVDEEAEEAETRAREAAEKKALARDALREQEAEEEEKEERYRELVGHCKKGRNALELLRAAMFCSSAALFLASAAAACLVVPFLRAIAQTAIPLGAAISQVGVVLMAIGFILAILGPPRGRHLPAIGLIAIALHLVGITVVLSRFARFLFGMDENVEGVGMAAYSLFGLISFLPLVADFPTRLVQGYEVSSIAVLLGAAEFVRLVVVCQLVELYATDGKHADYGFRAQGCGSRVLAMVILGGLFRLALSLFFDAFPPGEVMFYIGMCLHCAVLGALMWVAAFALLFLGQAIGDTIDVVKAERFQSDVDYLPV